MTTLELQEWKKNFIEDYLNEIDDVEEIPRPCVIHSKEDMITAIRESEEDIKHGRILSGEELEKEIETWF